MKAIAYSILAAAALAVCAYSEANGLLVGAFSSAVASICVIGLIFSDGSK